jgi:hypothetical protein
MVRRRPKHHNKAVTYTLLAIAGALAGAIGVLSLTHPVPVYFPGDPHSRALPGLLGVNLLVVPVVLVGIVLHRVGWTIEVDVEAWRERRRRRRQRAESR